MLRKLPKNPGLNYRLIYFTLNQFAINERSSDTNFKLKIFADVATEYSSCHQGAQLEPFPFLSSH